MILIAAIILLVTAALKWGYIMHQRRLIESLREAVKARDNTNDLLHREVNRLMSRSVRTNAQYRDLKRRLIQFERMPDDGTDDPYVKGWNACISDIEITLSLNSRLVGGHDRDE